MGWIKPRRVQDDSKGRYYDLWSNEDSSLAAQHRMHLPAPKTPLPGHHESYNPPPEYLFTEEEVGPPGAPAAAGSRLNSRPTLSAARSVGAAGPRGQEIALRSRQVLQPPTGSGLPSFHP